MFVTHKYTKISQNMMYSYHYAQSFLYILNMFYDFLLIPPSAYISLATFPLAF